MRLNQSFINRRKALRRPALSFAAPGVLAALAPVAEASPAPELLRFIEAHKRAKSAGEDAKIKESEARARHEGLPHPIADKVLENICGAKEAQRQAREAREARENALLALRAFSCRTWQRRCHRARLSRNHHR